MRKRRDRDRNGRVSVQEAFDFAVAKTKAAYEQGGHILTEHAALDDSSQGKLAAAQFFAPERSRTAAAQNMDPALRALLEQREALERQVERTAAEKRCDGSGGLRRAARTAGDGPGDEEQADPGTRRPEMKWSVAVLALVAATATAAAQGVAIGPWQGTRGAPIKPNVDYTGQFTFVRLRYGAARAVPVAADSVDTRLSVRRAALHADRERCDAT